VIILRSGVPLVDVERSGVVETVHAGHVVLLGADGTVMASLGDPGQPIFPRSSNKPLQAVGLVRAGLRMPARWLALASASHSGEQVHIESVRAMLASAGLDESALQCPPDWALGEAARMAAISDGRRPERITMNCSGKHAAMLLACVANGWPTEHYLDPGHPLQIALHDTVSDLAGEPIAATGVDGCGAPLFALSLTAVARAFSRLARATGGAEARVADAMREHPELVGGTGRSATELMNGIPGLIAKDGAEGVYAAALPDGSAVAVKIDDGSLRAVEPAVVAGLRRMGATSSVLDDLAESAVLGRGERVGSVRFRAGLL
jgi:L-asparaginase II